MKGTLKVIIVIAVILLVLGGLYGSTYNTLVTRSEQVDAQWAIVESSLQRRFDLIPNLVESVKGAMAQEQEVFGRIADARARMAGAGTVDERVAASNELESALGRLLVVMENYPQLQSIGTVNRLMDELAGTENRINVERNRYNEAVRTYNLAIKTFPRNLFAGMMGFETRHYFEAAEGAQEAPRVNF
ncbi:LemA family protein [Geosporobacter ferrireducens]|uniref:LemA family protein n=1 Tax=Geosporobacter ferrireducens TaxID=1424294 RepID=A0A1D8GK65_9FIRM|nr:LemA family protein [Geosporobacter ferrireducens]AOT71295.1 LemA family protein [Geosporobacter ferrireducens]MTI58109.1 LemA family protein [Geosporobacter ferrireducens]